MLLGIYVPQIISENRAVYEKYGAARLVTDDKPKWHRKYGICMLGYEGKNIDTNS